MKKYLCLIFIIVLACSSGGGSDTSIPDAGPEDYVVEVSERLMPDYWVDTDKVGNDEFMCWAAVASNMLVATEWEADGDVVFEYFKSNLKNKPGDIYDAFSFYFEDFNSHVIRESRYDFAFDFIASQLKMGRAVAILLKGPGHYVSVWGYHLHADTDILDLYITDSDDGLDRLAVIQFLWDGKWTSSGLYHGSWIDSVISLRNNK
jgi:hypothetical protein